MEFNVAQLLKEHVGATREYDVDAELESDEPAGLVGVGRVAGHVKFTRTNRSILVQGKLRTTVEVSCSRCLEQFRNAVEIRPEEEFFPTVDVLTGLPVSVPGDVLGFTIDANHILDLTEAVRQLLIVGLPMQPLCRPDCRGLCPICGQNWNEAECRCAEPVFDPRLAVLGELLGADDPARDKKGLE